MSKQKTLSIEKQEVALCRNIWQNSSAGEVIEVVTTPRVNPGMFRRRVRSLMLSGLSREEAEKYVASTPQKLELFYDVNLGAFAIDAEAVGNTPLYNPYSGKEIPDETK